MKDDLKLFTLREFECAAVHRSFSPVQYYTERRYSGVNVAIHIIG